MTRHSRRSGSVIVAIPVALALAACAPSAEEVASAPTTSGQPEAPAPAPAPTPPPAAPATPPAAPEPAPPAAAGGQRTTLQGVYTSDQADRGRTTFQTYCNACHNAQEFRGPAFQQHWSDRSVGELHEFISSMMPLDAPGSLSAQQYADIVAFFLGQNGYPQGSAELPTSEAALSQIMFVPAE